MNRDAALSILRKIQPELQARGVVHAARFGSIAREQATGASDIDVILTPAPGAKLSLFDLGALQTLLEEAFAGRSVDIVLAPVRKPALRQTIARDSAHAF
ncbi:MAG: nucleotidyltransferase domain-containing protein [Parvularculaceae bacterium]